MPSEEGSSKKLFVLDTNIYMRDGTCFLRFQEHDVHVPMYVIEELDRNKKGRTDEAYNARLAIRSLLKIMESATGPLEEGVSLATDDNKMSTGKLFFQMANNIPKLPDTFKMDETDNKIIAYAKSLTEKHPSRPVILVTNDLNMRLKAVGIGIKTEDYVSGTVSNNADLVYTGVQEISNNDYEHLMAKAEFLPNDIHHRVRVFGQITSTFLVNQFATGMDDNGKRFMYRVDEKDGQSVIFKPLIDYRKEKEKVFGIVAKNIEQCFALNLLMDSSIHLVTLLGQAGTGKTLLALAASLEQVMGKKRGDYRDIIVTRLTVPMGEDIGFLKGTEDEKVWPWMGAVSDNLEFLFEMNKVPETRQGGQKKIEHPAGQEHSSGHDSGPINELLGKYLKVKSTTFMRGRTLFKKFLIVDEAQNLTPKQMLTLITRAGLGTKVVCLGNLSQIDTENLTEGSSGLAYVVSRMKNWSHYGHVTLTEGERSPLATYASEVL